MLGNVYSAPECIDRLIWLLFLQVYFPFEDKSIGADAPCLC